MQNIGKYKAKKMQSKKQVLFPLLIVIGALAVLGWVGALLAEIIKESI